MANKNIFCYSILCLIHLAAVSCVEPITIGLVSLGAAGIGYLMKSDLLSGSGERCNEENIYSGTSRLEGNLARNLFGQHMVRQYVVAALNAHLQPNNPSRKPLVMSFHGTPGTGKSFVADNIAQSLYKHGLKSQYVHKYMGRADFSHPARINEYKERIKREVRESIQKCPRSLFIFDEVDKMPAGVFDTLTSLIDYAGYAKDADYTKAIFIFLSNTAGVRISDHLAALMKQGKQREATRLSDFEEMLKMSAYHSEGGLKMTNMIDAHVIDHYIPFLALEKAHVVQCVKAEFARWHAVAEPDKIAEVINSAVSYEPVHSLFATSGCKTIEKKVAIVVHGQRGN
ncbi:torsin-like protein [Drosophila sulfurigaster albostrigata]|uniref:torsin-like protein n=1 Tax=Drosophila sulfurigaster albostrigata TaxID=89887 RepID=UPI002D21CAD8|nr:torsin-like protein [Drosophila sulfurigaster albostrigata]